MNKMTPDQVAARKEFLMFIKSGDDVLRQEAYKVLTNVLAKNKAEKKERALAKKAALATFAEPAVVESPKAKPAKMVVAAPIQEEVIPKKRGPKPMTPEQKAMKLAQKAALAPKKRGRKPKVQAMVEVVPPKKRGPKPKMAATAVVVDAPKKRGPKPKVQAVEVQVAKRGPKPMNAQQKAVKAAQKALELATKALEQAQGVKKDVAPGRGRKLSIAKLRQDLGWTQSQMAAALGINQAIVSQIESGKITPSESVLAKAKEVKASN